ncbi:hypothetical protein EPI10_028402 [Gossypium australe]|uniref:Uncharacterized protein n=1 Tax=Gossypium australe TaxID=47621 RepID=A0A5B6UYF0_9ROSI|nr:hypothetical protein EPI10_028402 [Gossypium australe]
MAFMRKAPQKLLLILKKTSSLLSVSINIVSAQGKVPCRGSCSMTRFFTFCITNIKIFGRT